ncbi:MULTISPECIES: SIMPL domain-containing protein [Bacillus]|uniref:SIMPL domain-containing protein n=1 Tax=Bacillus TaxID=1386 RepID=UPI000BB8B00D|nr:MULTISPECIES: SIMPL domain-containing protein [Bacillus]
MNKNIRKIVVQGKAEKDVKPDIAYVTIGVMTSSKNAEEAQQENRVRANQMIAALLELGMDQTDIESTSYTVFPRYKDFQQGGELIAYEVRHLFKITVRNIMQVGTIYDVAFQNGANIAESITYDVSNFNTLYRNVLQRAVQDAYKKASAIASTIQVPLHPVPYKVEEASQPIFFGAKTMAFSVQEMAPTPIQPQDVTITATVNVEYVY